MTKRICLFGWIGLALIGSGLGITQDLAYGGGAASGADAGNNACCDCCPALRLPAGGRLPDLLHHEDGHGVQVSLHLRRQVHSRRHPDLQEAHGRAATIARTAARDGARSRK